MNPFYDTNIYQEQPEEYPAATFPRDGVYGNLQVTALMLIKTGTYKDQFNRPYVTDHRLENKDAIIDTVMRSYANYESKINSGQLQQNDQYVITPELIADAANSFVSPSARPESGISIPGNWNEARARFVLEFKIEMAGCGIRNFTLIGYTNGYGISGSHIAPDMEFTINSIFETRTISELGSYGMQQKTVLTNASQILTNNKYNGHIESSPQHRMRPEDVISEMQVSDIQELRNRNVVIDSRIHQTSAPTKSSYENMNPSNYLATIIGGLTAGAHQARVTNRYSEMYDLASQAVTESRPVKDPFIRAMSNIRGSALSNSFSFKDLIELDQNVLRDEVTTIFQPGQVQLAGMLNRPGQDFHTADSASTPWHGSDRPTLVATKIANALPQLMIDLMIRSCTIHATNMHGSGGMPITGLSNLVGIVQNVDMSSHGEALKMKFITHLLNDITFNNSIGFDIMVSANIVGEIWISLNLEGFPVCDYVVPAFANSLLSPILTRNVQNLGQLASDFKELNNNIFQQPIDQPPILQQQNSFWGGSSIQQTSSFPNNQQPSVMY